MKTSKLSNLLKYTGKLLPTWILVLLAACAAIYVYSRTVTRPWTRFGQVRAYVIQIAPRVSGRVVEIKVRDNEHVTKGELLFRINPEPYQLAVSQAERQLEYARLEVSALETAVKAAEAKVGQAKAAVASAQSRITEAEAGIKAAAAAVQEAESAIVSARAIIVQRKAEHAEAIREADRATRLAKQNAGSIEEMQSKAAAAVAFEAQVDSAKAILSQMQAALAKAKADESDAHAKLGIAQKVLGEAEAGHKTALVNQNEAEANLGHPGESNVRIKQAKVALDTAKLNLSFTSVYAPSDGYVTNLTVNLGTFANAGQPQLAWVNSESYWVYAYFRETQLRYINEGDEAVVTLMSHPDQPLKGKVNSIGQAIYPPNIATSKDLIPQIQPTFNWVRLAQRVPVRIHITEAPEDVRLIVGTTASVSIRPTQ